MSGIARRVVLVAVVVAGALAGAGGTAGAVGPFGPPQTLVAACSDGRDGNGDAAIAVDGTVRGFANCSGAVSDPIRYYRSRPDGVLTEQTTPYVGQVLATAWDGQNAIYVVIAQFGVLVIGKRVESTGAYSPLTTLARQTRPDATPFTADVVAAAGRWWAVWSEEFGSFVPGGPVPQTELFQRHTLLGVQGRTRVTFATTLDDTQPTLALLAGRPTMVWTRGSASAQNDLWIGQTAGGPWQAHPLATLGNQNTHADMTVSAGVTWVTWNRDGQIAVADNGSGTFASRLFTGPAGQASVAVSGTHGFVSWHMGNTDRVMIAERAGSTWTTAQLDTVASRSPRVLAQATRARVVYLRLPTNPGTLTLRTQT